MMAKPCRKDLLQWINVVSFAVDDVKLFLDTHPCDQNALAYFQEYSRMRNEALKEYAKYYGPLTIDTRRNPAQTDGTGSTSHGHGRKGDVNRCGIMRNDCSIR